MDHGFAMLNNQSLFFPFSPILCFPRNHHVFFPPSGRACREIQGVQLGAVGEKVQPKAVHLIRCLLELISKPQAPQDPCARGQT